MLRLEHMIGKLWQQSATHSNEISISDISLLIALVVSHGQFVRLFTMQGDFFVSLS